MKMKKILDRRSELYLSSESSRFEYLEERLSDYIGVEEKIDGARMLKYNAEIKDHDGSLLYFGGCSGPFGLRGAYGAMPFTSFAQDIICFRALLGVSDSDSHEAERFNDCLLSYVSSLYEKGKLHGPRIVANKKDPAGSIDLMRYAGMTFPADYISEIECSFSKVWLPKIEKNTGDYNPAKIEEKITVVAQ